MWREVCEAIDEPGVEDDLRRALAVGGVLVGTGLDDLGRSEQARTRRRPVNVSGDISVERLQRLLVGAEVEREGWPWRGAGTDAPSR